MPSPISTPLPHVPTMMLRCNRSPCPKVMLPMHFEFLLGYWQECLASLSQCIHLRRCIFEEDDFQYTGAVNHFLLSILNFASFFLRESATSDPKTKEIMLLRAFDLFKKSQDTLNSVSHIGQRAFFKAMISNNFANYFHRRKKEKAASQCALAAMKAFVRSRVSVYGFYFQVCGLRPRFLKHTTWLLDSVFG